MFSKLFKIRKKIMIKKRSIKPEPEFDNPKFDLKCNSSSNTFKNFRLFNKHKKKYKKHKQRTNANLRCKRCLQMFSEKRLLEKHTLFLHSDVEQFPCNLCSQTFPLMLGMHRHEGHGTGGHKSCSLCPQQDKKVWLKNHLATVHPFK